MKRIYRFCKKVEYVFRISAEPLAICINVIFWFAIGMAIATGYGLLLQKSSELISSYQVTLGALLSLVIGYIGGLLWLVRNDFPIEKCK